MKITRKQLLAMPKTDLHCHLDGSLRFDTICDLAKEYKIELPTLDKEKLKELLISGRVVTDLVTYLNAFSTTLLVLQEKDALTRAAFELAEDAAKENVWYLEVRFSPALHRKKKLKYDEIVEAVLAGLKKAEKKYGIRTGLIICAIRNHTVTEAKKMAELSIKYRDKGVVAFDLAGAEVGHPAKNYQAVFHHSLLHNINCTIHAGEACGPESISEAIHLCGARRIGHGTSLIKDPVLLDFVIDHRIPLEICLKCNVQSRSVKSIADHPLPKYVEKGLQVTLNTDNRLMSATTVTDEFWLAVKEYKFSWEQVQNIAISGFKSAFLKYSEKQKLITKVKTQLGQMSKSKKAGKQK